MSVRERKVARSIYERYFENDSVYVLRFTADGERHYVTLGTRADGWDDRRAIEERDNVMADVRRRIWLPPDRNKPNAKRTEDRDGKRAVPTFEEFSRRYLEGRAADVSESMAEYEQWAVEHLRPFFGHRPLNEIDAELVDDYRRHKVRQARKRTQAIQSGRPLTVEVGGREQVLRPLAPVSINKTLEVLQAILTQAVEYRHIEENPAEGRRRRLVLEPSEAVHLDTVDSVVALLDAAALLDSQPRYRMAGRLAMIAMLIFGGLRAHELCLLRWRSVDLASAKLRITRSKTQAGIRTVNLLPILLKALVAYKCQCTHTDPDDYVFPTGTGGVRDKDNVRNRVVEPVLRLADELLIARDQSPLPQGLSPHKLRHAFASILAALGTDPVSSKRQIGHRRYEFTLEVYTHELASDPNERERLRQLVDSAPPGIDADEPPDALVA